MSNNQPPPIVAQVIINYHGGDQFSVRGIPDIPLMFLMLGKAVASVGGQCKLVEKSPIVQLPPGARIVK